MEKRNSSFLGQMCHEVMFRKRNDTNYENFSNRRKTHTSQTKIKAFNSTRDNKGWLRCHTKIGELVGNQNEGTFFKEANRSAFKLKKRTQNIDEIEW